MHLKQLFNVKVVFGMAFLDCVVGRIRLICLFSPIL